jgi:hypothetical protein
MLHDSSQSVNPTNRRTGGKRPRVQFGPPSAQSVPVQTVQQVTVQIAPPAASPPTPKPQAAAGGKNKQFPAAA